MKKRPSVASIVFVIDEDTPTSLKQHCESDGLQAEPFGLADAFLLRQHPDAACCLAIEMRVPGLAGLEFHNKTTGLNADVPVVFVAGHGDIPVTLQAMQAGSVELLPNLCDDQQLLDAVRSTMEVRRARRTNGVYIDELKGRSALLTAREREVMDMVTGGFLNKKIAAEMGVREATVKLHRGNIMRKMKARSLADLVRMVDLLAIVD
jgi:FixJ family two-component response regulator